MHLSWCESVVCEEAEHTDLKMERVMELEDQVMGNEEE